MNGSAIPYNMNRMSDQLNSLNTGGINYTNQHQWGMASSIAGNALGTNPTLPYGYDRRSFNEEREMVARHYSQGALSAAGAFGAVTAAQIAIWGDPVQSLGSRMFGSGWNTAQEVRALSPHVTPSYARASMSHVRAGRFTHTAISDLSSATRTAPYIHPSATSRVMGAFPDAYNWLARRSANVGRIYGGAMGNVSGRIAGGAVQGALNLGGNIVGGAANYMSEEITGQAGSAVSSYFDDVARVSASAMESTPAGTWAHTFAKAKHSAGTFMSKPFRSMTAAAGRGVTGMATKAGAMVGGFLNPLTLAQMYITDKAINYGANLHSQHTDLNQLEKDMLAKSDRILKFGSADEDRGIAAGFSSAQRARFKETVRTLASTDAMKDDLFGDIMGKTASRYGIFGGLTSYSKSVKELKDIFNVGSDMGMFNSSKTFEDFEKKFTQTVEVVKKMSKLISKSKQEVMALMGSTQNEGFINSPVEMGNIVARKANVATITGADIGTINQEGHAISEMFRQTGFSPKEGSKYALRSRLTIDRAQRAGIINREDIHRMGGKQNMLVQFADAERKLLNDINFQTELARVSSIDEEGNVYIDEEKMARLESAGTDSVEALRETGARQRSRSVRSVSKVMGGKSVRGGWLIDRQRKLRQKIARGEIGMDTFRRIQSALEQQRHLVLNKGASPLEKEEALTIAYERMGMAPDLAAIKAKGEMGAFEEMAVNENLAVRRKRIADSDEANRAGYGGLGVYTAAAGAVATTIGKLVIRDVMPGEYADRLRREYGTGKTWKDMFHESTEDLYFSMFGETGKRKESDRALRRFLGNETDEDIIAGSSVKDLINAMRADPLKLDKGSRGVHSAVSEYSGVLSEMQKGVSSAQSKSRNYKLYEAMRESFRNVDLTGKDTRTGEYVRDQITSYLDIDFKEIFGEKQGRIYEEAAAQLREVELGNKAEFRDVIENGKLVATGSEVAEAYGKLGQAAILTAIDPNMGAQPGSERYKKFIDFGSTFTNNVAVQTEHGLRSKQQIEDMSGQIGIYGAERALEKRFGKKYSLIDSLTNLDAWVLNASREEMEDLQKIRGHSILNESHANVSRAVKEEYAKATAKWSREDRNILKYLSSREGRRDSILKLKDGENVEIEGKFYKKDALLDRLSSMATQMDPDSIFERKNIQAIATLQRFIEDPEIYGENANLILRRTQNLRRRIRGGELLEYGKQMEAINATLLKRLNKLGIDENANANTKLAVSSIKEELEGRGAEAESAFNKLLTTIKSGRSTKTLADDVKGLSAIGLDKRSIEFLAKDKLTLKDLKNAGGVFTEDLEHYKSKVGDTAGGVLSEELKLSAKEQLYKTKLATSLGKEEEDKELDPGLVKDLKAGKITSENMENVYNASVILQDIMKKLSLW